MNRRTAMPSIRVLALLLLVPLFGLAGCDTITGGDDDDIEGTWTLTEDDETVIVQITSSTISVFFTFEGADCYVSQQLNIVSSTGDEYTLQEEGGTDQERVIIRRNGDNLEVADPDDPTDVEVYSPSDVDVSTLEICTGGGAGDTSVACTERPQLTVGGSQSGALSSTDPTSADGSHYDMYGLQLTSTTSVQVDLMSDQIDAYLFLYDDAGSLIESNDDGGSGLNAQITASLDPGCYFVEATSFDAGETGSYTLSVN